MKRRVTAILCLLSLLFPCFAACRKAENKPAQASEPESTDPDILTHIYRETARSPVRTDSHSSGVFPFMSEAIKNPVNVSPAAVVSTAFTLKAFCL